MEGNSQDDNTVQKSRATLFFFSTNFFIDIYIMNSASLSQYENSLDFQELLLQKFAFE